MSKDVAPYGSWCSPITAETLARGSVTLAEPSLGTPGLSWVESRPLEGGRQVVVRASLDGSRRADAIPDGFSARTRVHEYGGGVYTLHGDALFFSNDKDGRVYRVEDGGAPCALSPEPAQPRSLRYADFDVAPDGSRVFCVRESHEGGGEPVNEVVSLAAGGGEPVDEVVSLAAGGGGDPTVVATGHDFYAAPRVSPDGTRLAWIAWDHPRMPWDGTELWTSGLDGSDAQLVAGGPEESVVHPAWSPAGVLHWVSDRSGWWNLYRDGEPLHPADAEFGAPLWIFGQSTYAFLDDGRIACAWSSRAFCHLGLLDPETGVLEELEVSHTPSFRGATLRSDGRRVAYVGASPTRAPAVVVVDTADGALTVVAQSAGDEPDPRRLSVPEAIEFPSSGRTAHALFYAPRNDDFEAPAGERPPLIVLSHGGPTAQAEPALDLRTQFWTSRGFAVVDVNYGGSTGYGRAYRELLRGQWGVVDLEDCTEAALHLARTGRADSARLAIRGGSAGGYTTLCALCFTDAFHVGASYFGVADIEALFSDTHKFESQYEYALVPPEKARERSPIHYVDRISAPVILFQGLEDPVVPPAQSERIAAALAERGVDYELHEYEGESHGFRKAETIIHSLESELAFYRRVLAITLA
jgi:dipeptidyl aminopeptidase/acylaminoacyl peptidase